MLEGLAAWVLNTYVGEYVENLNTDQLSIALLQGDVELENLPLKKDALKSLDIPLEVKSGVIGKIILHIPLRALRSQPWSITIENLYLVAGPLTHLQYNEKNEKEAKEAAKTAMLEALEAKWQILRQGKQDWATSSWFSYGTSMATNILENIQLNVKNVHIRYEDNKLNPEIPFAFGVVIDNLSVQSTDHNWKKEFINESKDINYKLVDLNNFSIYCDSNTPLLGSLPGSKFKEAMQKNMSKDHHDYILKPISASARVKRYTSALPLRSSTTPRISVDFILEAIHFTLSQDQFKFLGLWNREFERHNRRRKYRKNRPDCTVKKGCKKWWRFAIGCYLNEISEENKRRTWEFILNRSRMLVDYYDCYLSHLLEKGSNQDNEYHKTKIEKELDYEELKIVRELVLSKLQSENRLTSVQSFSLSSSKKSSETEVTKVTSKSSESQPGLFQSWFPGWGGWYQTSSPHQPADVSQSQTDNSSSLPDQTTAAEQLPTEIEREIMDVIQDSTENSSFLRKDTIFARMKFTLNKGSFCLLENIKSPIEKKKSVADLQCSTITMEFESRPRTSAMKFSLAVQGLQLQDSYNNFKSFPYLIIPQTQTSFPRSPPHIVSQKPDIPDPGGTMESDDPPFCQLVFEKNPVTHFHRYRISVKTRAIDIIYNPLLLNKIKEFFTLPSSGIYKRSEGTQSKLRELKKQTQDELQKTLTQFLESNQGKSKARWDVNFDISAPKFIIPENLSDPNSVMVVLDLGNFKLQTFLTQPIKSPTSPRLDEDVTEDDFHTPLSTPPNEPEDLDLHSISSSTLPSISSTTLPSISSTTLPSISSTTLPSISPSASYSSDSLHDHFYEKYIVDLTDLQVLQGRSDNNWRYAYSKGTSSMHVIDKFTISLQLERRLVSVADLQFPNMTISGTLPTLTFHLSEGKIMALQNCWDRLTSSSEPVSKVTSPVTRLEKVGDRPSILLTGDEKVGKSEDCLVDSKLIMLRFFINKLSLEMQSRGRALVELQVTGVEANLSHKKLNTSLALTVHSLLIVDALQSYGPDFELLVASHKNLVLDSQSGCIRGSNPASPSSPQSPDSPSEVQSAHSFYTIQDVLTQAFDKVSMTPGLPIHHDPSDNNILLENKASKAEALISLEFEVIKSERADNSLQTDVQILNLQFNSLDLIANQETLVELISFVKRSTQPATRRLSNTRPNLHRQETSSKMDHSEQKKESKLHINADFSRLNILLPRFLEENGQKVGHKIATATMSTAKVEAVFGDEWQVQGALGGLHLSDVTTDGGRYRQVFSIGDFTPSSAANEMFRTTVDEKIFTKEIISPKNACSFMISKSVKKQPHLNEAGNKITDVICAKFEMASVCYTHCPQFLDRLANCLSAFHDYMTVVANSLKYAATEVAYGLVGGRGDNLDMTATSFTRRDISLSEMTGILLEEGEGLVAEEQNVSVIKIVAKMETPIIVVPRAPNSSHVFLAHLGQVNITNYPADPDCRLSYEDLTAPTDKIHVSLINMNCYSADLEKLGILKPLRTHLSQEISEKSFYSLLSQERGIPIIYDTAVDLIVTQESSEVNYINPKLDGDADSSLNLTDSVSMTTTNNIIDVSAKIKSPIKVVLCKEVYEQFLQTLDNLAYTEEVVKTSSNINQGCPSTSDSESSLASPLLSQNSPEKERKEVEKYVAKHFRFEVPLFEAELRGDFGDGEQGLANLKLHDFSLKFKKDNDHLTNIEFRLRSLTMEDLLESEDSLYRHIMVSRNSSRTFESKQLFLSTSCPDSTIVTPIPTMPSSLPSCFKDDLGLGAFKQSATLISKQSRIPFVRSQSAKGSIYPCTPPPSPLGSDTPQQSAVESDDLVYIDFILVDKNSPEYVEKYDKTNRFIDIKFRCLETTINLQTWVVLLDFLGLGAKISDMSAEDQLLDSFISKTVTEDEPVNSKINFSVESFTLVLNKKDYELARANITYLNTNIEQRNGNLGTKGELGSISLLDNSPSGELYREKFISVGKQALQFDFFKHGVPDYNLQREYDMYLTLNMASVRYTHTNRFQAEILAFCQHFLQLQDVLGRMRAASAGKLITDKAMRGARIKLEIDAGSPILLIPQSSKTDRLLVADLGKLRLTNCFKHDATPGTITFLRRIEEERKMAELLEKMATSTPKKKDDPVVNEMNESIYSQYLPKPEIDPMSASIIGSLDRDVREDDDYYGDQESLPIGTSIDPLTPPPGSTNQSPSSPQPAVTHTPDTPYQCLLDVMKITLTDMDLYTAKRVNKKYYKENESARVLEFPSCIVQEENGRLLEEACILELDVERNLEGDISHTAPDWRVAGKLSSVVCHLDLQQYKLVRGILDHNLGEAIEEFERPLMSHLKDPSIQTILSGEVYNCINMVFDLRNVTVELLQSHQDSLESPEVSLAKLDFIQSQLTYTSASNQSKDISLWSHAIVVSDTRYKKEPMNSRPNVFVNILQPKVESDQSELQLEINYRSTKESTQFTVLLNKMKIMCVFDWLVCVQEFLMTSPDNPFVSGEEKISQSMLSPEPGPSRNRGASPLNISQSLATKRGPFPEEVKIPFIGRLNLQDTQLIVVGDTTSLDTSAVILQLTSVIMFKPQASDKVLTCDISTVEVFSCCLMAQDETAQSIIDPLAITVDLNANPPLNLRPSLSEGLLDVSRVMQRRLVLQVNFNILNIRVSYQDMMLFKSIMDSLPQQALQAKQSSSSTKIDVQSSNSDVQQLMSMGFDKNDCFYALQFCHGNVDEAAMWLTKHAKIVTKEKKNSDFALTGVEVKATSVYFCLIDDCGADVPLAEISFNGLDISQSQEPNIEGKAKLHIIGSYYNRNLSGWEPFLEAWPCYIEWKSYTDPKEKLAVQVSSPEVLNLNITSTLLKQYNETKGTWTEDYTKQTCEDNEKGENEGQVPKRRSPFIPYKLINKTGCKIQFTTATTTPTSGHNESRQLDDRNIRTENWHNVLPDQEVPFKFTRKEKARHKKTHEMYHNQLLIKIDGWQKPSAVCVDKVGIYFRHADVSKRYLSEKPLFPIRMKYEVKQVGSAGKVITISSALMLVNKLDSPVELKLEHNDLSGQYESMVVQPDTPTPLPLHSVYYKLWARPLELSLNYCDQPIKWLHVFNKGQMDDSIKQCNPIEGHGVYRFCVCVRRENYPTNEEVANELELEDPLSMPNIPGHTITLLPPLTIQSLLPIELHYYLKHTNISGNLKAGKQASIHAADITKDFEIGIHLENFESCKEVNIPPKLSYKYRVKLRLYDKLERLLELTMRIQSGPGGTIGVSIAAPYWIVNKSGLPLLFKQEGTKMEAAGQFEEHEFARSVTPLLFSFNEKDEPTLICVRLGKKHHGDDSLPQWSQKLSIENGVGTRQLHVVPRQMNRPDWVYNIGYQLTKGKGKFRDTQVISIAPRYEVDNQSNYKLAIAQRHLISSQNIDSAFLTALPKCKLPYHWPRMDLDQLLCVRIMDYPSCNWSGGFCVDKSKSFHLNMRDGDGKCLLLKVEIICQGPTFIIVLVDADTMPPPFRLDNHSPIAVKFFQSQVSDPRLQSVLHPNTSSVYSWDELILEPVLSLQIPGGMTAHYNLNQLGEGPQLLYENYIYLAATHTFDRPVSCGRELVLESTHENHVIFKKKEKYKKTQMWRMTSEGLLEHYGSVQPTETGSTSKTRPRGLVLDILDLAPRPEQSVPLFLRKPDERRKSTQTWKFTEDGMLQSVAGPMCVQVLGGLNLLQDGAVAVLGPCRTSPKNIPGSTPPSSGVPPHKMISRQKLRPGSGCLSVKVVMDGPIRVLEIADRQATEIVHCELKDMSDWEVYDVSERVQGSTEEVIGPKQLEVTMSLKGGLGISVINQVPEELLYVKLSNISLEIVKSSARLTVESSVASVQVDNQIIGASRPVVLFVTQTNHRETVDNTPALFITAHKLPSGKWNAEIYKHLIVTTKRLTILLEEKLILKLLLFLGYETNGSDIVQLDDNNHQVLPTSSAIQAKRYYFSSLKIKTGRVTLSMATSSNLSPDLQLVKHSLAVPLIAFEDAKVDLDPFTLNHPFETSSFLFNEIVTHYAGELKGQATKILGSIDVLGNPLGFVNDVTEGISGLIKDGNVTGLFKNVTHGVSNTAAKMTGALSDGFASVSMDDDHMKQRDELRHVETGQSRAHLMAGVKGLGYGILGGLTGLVTQPYSGAKEKGIGGFFKGAGKGIVGTVTKPVTGVLDFTSGVANAVRDKSQVSSKQHPPRSRDPRVSPGIHGVVSTYSPSLARAQIHLYSINNNNHNEYIIALEYLGFGENSLLSMVSSQYVRILKRESRATEIILTAKLNDIVKAEYTVEFTDSGEASTSKNEARKLKEKIYLKLTMKADLSNKDSVVKQPSIRCDRINIAKKVCQQINYARNLYDDETHTLIQTDNNGDCK